MDVKERIAKLFFEQPMGRFGVRELARLTEFDTKTVMKYAKALLDEDIIIKKTPKGAFAYYEANRSSPLYRFEKKQSLLRKVIKSGVLEFLDRRCRPRAVVLFGSVQKGTYHAKSDIDLFVQAPRTRVDLFRFNKNLGHEIRIFFDDNIDNLSDGLRQNIYNGEVLSGTLKLP